MKVDSGIKQLKTPLRYPGGKSRACNFIFQDKYLPDMSKIKVYQDVFLGGGSTALYITKRFPHVKIQVNDIYENLYQFWTILQQDCPKLVEQLLKIHEIFDVNKELQQELFKTIQHEINIYDDPFEKAWRFYALNKLSFSGLTERGTLAGACYNTNFSVNLILKLPEYSKLIQHWEITNKHYVDMLSNDPETMIFLDPPYQLKQQSNGNALYGKDGKIHAIFNHQHFYDEITKLQSKCLITYNSMNEFKQLYSEWDQIEWDLTYTMGTKTKEYIDNQSSRKELLLKNYTTTNQPDLNHFFH